MQIDTILPCLHQQKWLYLIVASDNIRIVPPKAKNCNQCSAALKSAQKYEQPYCVQIIECLHRRKRISETNAPLLEFTTFPSWSIS